MPGKMKNQFVRINTLFLCVTLGGVPLFVRICDASDLCVFSTEELRTLLNESGIEDFLSYNYSPRLQLLSKRTHLVIQGRESDPALILDSQGDISVLDKPWGPQGVYFWRDKSFCIRFNTYGNDKGIRVTDQREFELFDREQVPVIDESFLVIGRRFVDNEGIHRFKLVRLSDSEELGDGTGKLLHVNTNGKNIVAVVSMVRESVFSVMKYEDDESIEPTEIIKISPPGKIQKGYVFGFSDFDLSSSQVSFVEYRVPGRMRDNNRVWIFDLAENSYQTPRKIGSQKGHIFALFVERSLREILNERTGQPTDN